MGHLQVDDYLEMDTGSTPIVIMNFSHHHVLNSILVTENLLENPDHII